MNENTSDLKRRVERLEADRAGQRAGMPGKAVTSQLFVDAKTRVLYRVFVEDGELKIERVR